MIRFLKGLNLSILDKVELQPSWTFEDACKLTVKVEKQLKSRRAYPSGLAKLFALIRTFNSYRLDHTPKEDKGNGNGKEIAEETTKNHKKCFNCHGYGHFQADRPKRKVLTIKKIEDVDQIEVTEDDKES